jgi:hypothetical protein
MGSVHLHPEHACAAHAALPAIRLSNLHSSTAGATIKSQKSVPGPAWVKKTTKGTCGQSIAHATIGNSTVE